MSLDLEIQLTRLEAEVAAELPAHVEAFANAHVAGRPQPPAPQVLGRVATIARPALADPALARRALILMRLAPNTGRAAMHALHGATPVGDAPAPPAADPRWREPDGIAVHPILAWRELSMRHAARCDVRFVQCAARPRTFVVAHERCIVAVPAVVDSPATRFALLHELGHVLAAALAGVGLPRALDEGVAAFAARDPSPLAIAARQRRLAIARQLARVEAGAAAMPDPVPWALIHDRFAQASYVAADAIADELEAENLAASIAQIHARIDAAAVARLGV